MSKIAESKKNGENNLEDKVENKNEKVAMASKASKIDEMIEKNKANAKKVGIANKKEQINVSDSKEKASKKSTMNVVSERKTQSTKTSKKSTSTTEKATTKTTAKKTTKATVKPATKSATEPATTGTKKTDTNSNTNKQSNNKSVNKTKNSNSAKVKKNENEKTNSKPENVVNITNKKIKNNVENSEGKELKNSEIDEVTEVEEKNLNDESKYDTISLKEIREAIENKVDTKQKRSILKEVFINMGMAVLMILYLVIVWMGNKNILGDVLVQDLKVMTLIILGIGIVILEVSYKRDNSKIALNSAETITFGGANLCLIYVVKLYRDNLIKVISYIGIVVIGYYIAKSIFMSINNIRKFKKNNNDIKEIIK